MHDKNDTLHRFQKSANVYHPVLFTPSSSSSGSAISSDTTISFNPSLQLVNNIIERLRNQNINNQQLLTSQGQIIEQLKKNLQL